MTFSHTGLEEDLALFQHTKHDGHLKPAPAHSRACGMQLLAFANVTGIKRDLCSWQKRPAYMAKETYVHGKRVHVTEECIVQRDLRAWQKRPAYTAKETCVHGKRDLRTVSFEVSGARDTAFADGFADRLLPRGLWFQSSPCLSLFFDM